METENPANQADEQSTQQQPLDLARAGQTEALHALLEKGFNPNFRDEKGQSLLMLASYNGHYETTKLLLEYGSIVDLRNLRGQTSLGGAAFKGYLDVVQLLVEHGADVNGDNGYGLTPLALAKMFAQESVEAYLLSKGGRQSVGTAMASIPGQVLKTIRNARVRQA
ncbi:MAG: ankyrin repeat domain-containing protein [Verrucomicrobiota bacterium]